MSCQIVIELSDPQGVQAVLHALESYKARLRASIERGRRKLVEFEQRYGVETDDLMERLTAEDLAGGDLDYVEWVGEAKLLAGVEAELRELEDARYQLP